jgi:precorrin-4 methylase
MRQFAYRVAREDMRALRRQTLAKVFHPGMTAIEASHAVAMELGYSFTDTTIHSDLKALGLTPVSGTERAREMAKARRAEVRKGVLTGESVQSLAERLKAPVYTIKSDCHVLVETGDIPVNMLARGRVQRRLAAMTADMARLGPEAQAAYAVLCEAVADGADGLPGSAP